MSELLSFCERDKKRVDRGRVMKGSSERKANKENKEKM